MRVAIYARVSTDRGEQDPAVQIEALQGWLEQRGDVLARVFSEHVSGAKRERPELDVLLREVEAGAFDAVAVVKLDRLARSTRHLLELSAFLQEHDVDLLVKDQAIDTTTPAGRLMFTVLGAVAEFERDLIRERTRAGLDHARRKGTKLGRPRLQSETLDRAVFAVNWGGMPIAEASRAYGISRSTLRRHAGLVGR